ncbi:GntR family transcriptional regulator [Caulobacter henricii]|uniref:HTH gntR-type domain-containing protein n=1 Tax=Caulobacter henricii TaxID=69395 RepID=A0A0P0NYA3_9CAUL|nr:GntR family transcriptional regulator [Caulobacter henricii]ALL13080.1 hypothetical protein AQ619_06795 [Caulobacter henricii]
MIVLPKSDQLPRPLYRSLHQAVALSIRDGRLRPGDRLPTERDLAHRCGVSRITVRAALDGLGRDKLVARRTRTGTIVTEAAARGESDV